MKTLSSIILVLFCSFYLIGQTVNVQTYGATPNNNTDNDYTAIADAIAACQGLSNPVLILPEGTYHITSVSSGTPYFPIDGIDNLTIQGEGLGAELEFTGFNYNRDVFKFTNCKNLNVQNLKIDYTEPPFTQGKILNSGSGWMRIEVQEGFQNIEPGNKPDIRAYALYDNITGQQISNIEHFDNNQSGADWYWFDKPNKIMNIGYNSSYGYPNGGYILLRHKMYDGYSFIVSKGCENVIFNNITIFIAPGYPFYAERGPENISFINCRVEKKQVDYWMTSTVDAAHLLDARGDIIFDNCLFENMGDDGINLHGYYFYIISRTNNTTLEVQSLKNWHFGDGFKVGDRCEFFDIPTSKSIGFGIISNITKITTNYNNSRMILTFESNLPNFPNGASNYYLSNIDLVGKLTVRKTTIKDNRSRGILVSSNDVIIEECLFERNLLPAIKFEINTEWNGWQESTAARNAIIRNNTFDDANFYQTTAYPGIISFKNSKDATSVACDVFKNIRITGNTIKNNSSPFIYARQVQNLEVSNNTFQNFTGDGNLIQYGESQNQVFSNNTNAIEDDMGSNCTPTTETPSVVLDPKTLNFTQIESTRLSATVSPFTALIEWDSDDINVATVDQNGTVTVTGAGTANITATITDGGSPYSDTCIVTVEANSNTLSIGYNEKSNTIQVYPNPAHDVLNVVVNSNYNNLNAKIIDLSGRIILNEKLGTSKNTIDLSAVSNGIYMLNLKDGDKLINVRKIIINH